MARVSASLASAVTVAVIAVHAVLLPVLYFTLGYVVRTSHEHLFIDHARTFARVLADQLEMPDVASSPQRVADLLDLPILNGEGAYAEYVGDGSRFRSPLGLADVQRSRKQDFNFGDNDDHIYFIKLPITSGDHVGELRLGFDERPTEERIALALHRTLLALSAYLAISLIVAIAIGLNVARSLRQLQRMSRQIASGGYAQRLHVESRIRELQELAVDMDEMRRALVGVNERLRSEIQEKEAAEAQREQLQNRLRHRQRLETVGTLAGGIAHEFNNALLPITLLTESALAGMGPSDPLRPDLQRVLGSARRAREVVRKILMFSHKFGEAKLELIDLRAVVGEALNLFAPLVSSNVEVETAISGPPLAVKADASLVLQMVMNLCVNAYQAIGSNQGKVTIGVDSRHEPAALPERVAAGSYVELWVRDNGHGMDPATVERIFEPFFTTRDVGQGTGLGLSVVHGIAEAFGATILVVSATGVGTTFRVLFPAAPVAAASKAATGTSDVAA
ncbi:MAG TPA: ATP-binding protein [Steroidobacteraceae bacterium]